MDLNVFLLLLTVNTVLKFDNFFILEKKKTFIKTIPMTYANFFPLFYKYWDIVSKRGTEHTALAVEILTGHIFTLLQIKWDKNKWDSKELKHI